MSTSVTLAYTVAGTIIKRSIWRTIVADVPLGMDGTLDRVGLGPATSDSTVINGNGSVTRTLVYPVLNTAETHQQVIAKTKGLFTNVLYMAVKQNVSAATPVVT